MGIIWGYTINNGYDMGYNIIWEKLHKKHSCCTYLCAALQSLWKGLQAGSLVIFEWAIQPFSNYVTSKETVSHNVLYYQPLSIAR